jgi:hypothetical protein
VLRRGPLRRDPRQALLSAAAERAGFEELLPAALASVPLSSNLTAAHGWSPLLAAAFPLGHSEATELTPAQCRYLSALVDRDEVWRFSHLTAPWLQDVCLPPTGVPSRRSWATLTGNLLSPGRTPRHPPAHSSDVTRFHLLAPAQPDARAPPPW